MPAVIGVVFVFLVAVIVWVILRGGEAGDPAATPDTAPAPATTPEAATTAPMTTTPAPMPDVTATTAPEATTVPETTVPETTVPETTVAETTPTETTVPEPATTAPVTTAPGAEPDAVPGDLAIPGRPMQRPGCDGSFITIVASAIGDHATADGIAGVIESYPGSDYLRTDQTCSSLRQHVDGEPIYVVYLGPFPFQSDACTARAEGPEGAYAKQLSNDVPPDEVVSCG